MIISLPWGSPDMLFPRSRQMDRAQRASLPSVLPANWQRPSPDVFGVIREVGRAAAALTFITPVLKAR